MSEPPTTPDPIPPESPSVLNAIRTETALSRFPCHRIARKGRVDIELKNQASAVLWLVDYSSRYGQPGPLAYKLDTLIINRRLDELGRPVPRLLKLGSLRDICRELEINEGTATQQVKKALLQNASAFITAKITYRATDGTEKHLEAGFNRYAVVFTGETLPDGRTADAVYLILSDIYQEVLNHALTRPLDYEYMKALPPAAQRFYEIVSYQIYAALKHQNPRARLLYSEYCLLSTATRYFDFDHVKKQMYKTHKPHLESGYLLKTQYEATTDGDGKPDWIMYYTPGPNADREYQAFVGGIRSKRLVKQQERRERGAQADRAHQAEGTDRGEQRALPFSEFLANPAPPARPAKRETPPPPVPEAGESPAPSEPSEPPGDPAVAALLTDLTGAGLNRSDAQRFAQTKPDESRLQLEYLPHVPDLRNRGGYLRRAIENGFGPPAAYVEAKEADEAKRRKEAETQTRKARQEAQEDRQREEMAQVDLDIDRMEIEAPAAFQGFLRFVERKREEQVSRFGGMSDANKARITASFATPERRRELFLEWQKSGVKENLPGAKESTLFPAGTAEEGKPGPTRAASVTRARQAKTPSLDPVREEGEIGEDTGAIRALIQKSLKEEE